MLIQLTFIYLHLKCKKMQFNLKNIQTAPSRNGFSLKATLTINGIETCTIRDYGDGSDPDFQVVDRDLFKTWEKGIDQIPPTYYPDFDMELPMCKTMFIDLLHYALESKTEFKLLSS